MSRRLVGLVGLARSGKDSAANYMVHFHGFDRKAAYAEPLKRTAMCCFDLTADEVNGEGYDREQPHEFWGISVRDILQRLGTESIRDVFGKDHWIRLMDRRLSTGDLSQKNVVVTDLRFEDEVQHIRQRGGKILGVVRTKGQPDIRPHRSEEMAALRIADVCDKVVSARDLPSLEAAVEKVMREWYGMTL